MTTIIIVEGGIVQCVIQVEGEYEFIVADFDDQSEEELSVGQVPVHGTEDRPLYVSHYLGKIHKHKDMKEIAPKAAKAIKKEMNS